MFRRPASPAPPNRRAHHWLYVVPFDFCLRIISRLVGVSDDASSGGSGVVWVFGAVLHSPVAPNPGIEHAPLSQLDVTIGERFLSVEEQATQAVGRKLDGGNCGWSAVFVKCEVSTRPSRGLRQLAVLVEILIVSRHASIRSIDNHHNRTYLLSLSRLIFLPYLTLTTCHWVLCTPREQTTTGYLLPSSFSE
ncbi:hypothetical protein CC78DRAFT_620002 [Lojkania enalia]|uniref:Uncharacterized protein n=1 Tax=Lojkania enalia TaxID=147567 RepID=A0A9P4K0N1_9PLEO|nr:hypothetical protein CC78DRAFT_620002 [Didymosphaeria enalia]